MLPVKDRVIAQATAPAWSSRYPSPSTSRTLAMAHSSVATAPAQVDRGGDYRMPVDLDDSRILSSRVHREDRIPSARDLGAARFGPGRRWRIERAERGDDF